MDRHSGSGLRILSVPLVGGFLPQGKLALPRETCNRAEYAPSLQAADLYKDQFLETELRDGGDLRVPHGQGGG